MSWFVDARGTRAMAGSAMSADADSSFGTAEVHTTLQAAHKLVWEHEVKHGAQRPSLQPYTCGLHASLAYVLLCRCSRIRCTAPMHLLVQQGARLASMLEAFTGAKKGLRLRFFDAFAGACRA